MKCGQQGARGANGGRAPGPRDFQNRIMKFVTMRKSVSLEILDFALVLLCRSLRRKSSEVAPLACTRILLAGIESVVAVCKFADHRRFSPRIVKRERPLSSQDAEHR